MHHARFHRIVLQGRGAVQVDIVDLAGRHAGACQCLLDRQPRASAGRIGRRHMMAVRRFAPAAQGDRSGTVLGLQAHQKQRRALADIDAVAIGAERIAWRGADRLKCAESGYREGAQRIDAAGQDCIAHPHLQQASRARHRFGARRASAGVDIGRSANAELRRQHRCWRAQFLLAVMELHRQGAVRHIFPHRGFTLGNAGGAGAEHDADACRAMASDRGIDRRPDLFQGGQRQLVVAAALHHRQGRRTGQHSIHQTERQHASRRIGIGRDQTAACAEEQAMLDRIMRSTERANHA